jgi:hypothetical protein
MTRDELWTAAVLALCVALVGIAWVVQASGGQPRTLQQALGL